MTIFSENLNTFWCSLIIEEFVRHDIFTFCISPGSRSAPLAVAVARHPKAKGRVFFDERAAAFYALGYARAAGKVTPLISTSGTAVANYFPAVIESSTDFVPLIVLSADRPPELIQTGANQAIQQTQIFGEYIKWHFELPCPDEAVLPAMVLTTIDQAIYQAHNAPAGPVHLNCMFREPLEPSVQPVKNYYINKIKAWQQTNLPYTFYFPKISIPDDKKLDKIIAILNSSVRGFISVGQLKTTGEAESVVKLIDELQWPWYADISSGLRIGKKSKNHLAYFDLLLSSNKFIKKFNPKTILHLGGQITSKRYLNFLEKYPIDNFMIVRNGPFRYDPAHMVTHRIETELSYFCKTIKDKIMPKTNFDWNQTLIALDTVIEQVLNKTIDCSSTISQPAVIRKISQILGKDDALFLANSLTIREIDWYASPENNRIYVAANRGASGIDGTLASALGFSDGLKKRLTLIIGDIAFIHDINSLSLIQYVENPIIIILINNQGGGIFSFLPIAQFDSFFKKFFATPHRINFKHAAELFQLPYAQPSDINEFIRVYELFYSNEQSGIIEIQTDREKNFTYQNNILKKIDAALIG